MLVYRIELKFNTLNDEYKSEYNCNSVGPYCISQKVRQLQKELNLLSFQHGKVTCTTGYHPTPERSDIPCNYYYKYNILYGFKNIKQLLDWFTVFLLELHSSGYHLVVYDVPEQHVYMATHQLVFDINYAKVVEFKSLAIVHHKHFASWIDHRNDYRKNLEQAFKQCELNQ